jgi:N-acetylglucosaminyldiphosphoundecaprenol N-acetyl-beta-D-mannosaminyltransferase
MALALGLGDDVAVGPFRVADRTARSVVAQIVELALTKGRHELVACYALHVQGLNLRGDPTYVAAMNRADLVYADGGSVVLLAKMAGARSIERAPTTDIGWEVLSRLTDMEGAPPRVALLGCGPGIAERAAEILREKGLAEPVLVAHGFQADWEPIVQQLRELRPRLVLLGLGSPREMVWVETWGSQLETGTVLTCGGWFGFIAGDERRAPAALRRGGLEWIARLSQSPTRLAPRYARGLASTMAVAPAAMRQRHRPVPIQRIG